MRRNTEYTSRIRKLIGSRIPAQQKNETAWWYCIPRVGPTGWSLSKACSQLAWPRRSVRAGLRTRHDKARARGRVTAAAHLTCECHRSVGLGFGLICVCARPTVSGFGGCAELKRAQKVGTTGSGAPAFCLPVPAGYTKRYLRVPHYPSH
jgi:hypothetical protein